MKRMLLLATLSLWVSGPRVWAINDAAGTGGAAFMKIDQGSARAQALGGAYVALAEGAEALTWNPAGLALAQQREAAYSYLRYVQDIEAPLFMAYAQPLGRTVVGANVAYMRVNGFEARDAAGIPQDNSNIIVQNGFATLSAARSFLYEKLFLGASLKAVHENDAGANYNTMVGDFGVLLKPNSYVTFGFATQNFGAGRSRVTPVTRGGMAFRPWEMLTASLELSKPSDNNARLGLGLEFTLPEDLLQVGQVSLRVGYYSTDDLGIVLPQDRSFLYPLVSSPKISYGIGLYSAQAFGYGIGFDYALVPFGALGTVDQLSFKVRF